MNYKKNRGVKNPFFYFKYVMSNKYLFYEKNDVSTRKNRTESFDV